MSGADLAKRIYGAWLQDERCLKMELPYFLAEIAALASAAPQGGSGWRTIESDPPPKDEMFIWAYRWEGRWRLGLAYRNVSGGWSDCYGDREAPTHATHWAPLPSPPQQAADHEGVRG